MKSLKIFSGIGIFIAWAFLVALFLAGIMLYRSNNLTSITGDSININSTLGVNTDGLVDNQTTLNINETKLSIRSNNTKKSNNTINIVTKTPEKKQVITTSDDIQQYTLSQVSSHHTSGDCWMIISNKVYDVTNYITSHPGGSAILSGCGKDATDMYAGIGHDSYAYSLLAAYYIGDLISTPVVVNNTIITNTTINNTTNNNTQNNSNNSSNSQNNTNSNNNNSTNSQNNTNNNTNNSTNNQGNDNNNENHFEIKDRTLSEISIHNSASSCWMIIDNKVYDFTSYVSKHPGGTGSIISGCGKDATVMYNNIGHDDYAKSLLSKYFIGNLITDTNHNNDDDGGSDDHESSKQQFQSEDNNRSSNHESDEGED